VVRVIAKSFYLRPETYLAFFVQEDFFDIFPKYAGNLKGQVQPWLVFAGLNRVDALPRHADGIGKVGL